jgi:hypothetical protein
MVTYILIALAAVAVVVVVVAELRSWRKPGRRIPLNAPMDSDDTNDAHLIQGTNIHRNDTFGSSGPI